jgi:trigger factor
MDGMAVNEARLALEVKSVREEDAFGRHFSIEVAGTEVAERFEAALEELRRRMSLPGFRKGKVPRGVVESRFGREVRADVAERLLPEAVRQVIEERGLHPIGEPHAHELAFREDGTLAFDLHLDVRPEFTPADPRGIKLDKVVHPVGDEDVERVIEELRDRVARIDVVDRPAAPGDLVTIDLAELGAGQVPILGRKQLGVRLPLIAGTVPQSWIDALTGRRAGETAVVDVPAPEPGAGGLPHAAGARYHQLAVKQVEAKSLPELDDAFATRIGAPTVAELRIRLRRQLEAEEEDRAQRAVERELLDRLAAGMTFEIPDRLVNPAADRIYGRVMAQMPDLPQAERERVAVEARTVALAELKRELVLGAVAGQQRIEVSQAEADAELTRIETLERQLGEPRRVRSGSERVDRVERLQAALRERKVLKYLVDTADVQVVQQSATRKRIVTPYDP